MAGGTHEARQEINWAEHYIVKLSSDLDGIKNDMREIREGQRDMVKHVQILAITVIIGVCAVVIAMR